MFKQRKLQSAVLVLAMVLNLFLPIFAETTKCKYCDFSTMYVGEDKYEIFNRKMFDFNSKLNKFVACPFHILWSSIMPKYGIDRLENVYHNIEYPKRLTSCLLQKDFNGAKSETKRFLTNTTIGLGGLFDPAKRFMKLKPVNENMEQALCKCKMKSGSYMVMPLLSSCCPRSLLGRTLEVALDPALYLASPIASLIKFGLLVNRTSYMQPLAKMIESTYADPYDITKKLYGMENYIKTQNLDRKDLLSTDAKIIKSENLVANLPDNNEKDIETLSKIIQQIQDEEEVLGGMDELAEGNSTGYASELKPDIILKDFHAQSPVVDSMRTALFEVPNLHKSMWNELSVWNRSFAKRIKTGSVSIYPEREDYKFRYILQKTKNAPLAILYPSIGEGINSHHSVVFAKIFYDAGYSVLIQGSHFQWEFAKSMPEDYYPGIPSIDAENLKLVTSKIINKLEKEEKKCFNNKVLVGTSLGAMATLFVGEKEFKNNTLGISKFIAISPPIELVYAIKQVDKNSKELESAQENSKYNTAITAAKILQLLEQKKESDFKFNGMPFSEDEGKLITSFLMRQKLSDLVFTIEKQSKLKPKELHTTINNLSYKDYAEKYLLKDVGGALDDLVYDTSLYSIAGFLKESPNYKIYHSLDDFLINKKQLEQLKLYAPNQVICLNNGAHLGFLYRKEFIDSFKRDIVLRS